MNGGSLLDSAPDYRVGKEVHVLPEGFSKNTDDAGYFPLLPSITKCVFGKKSLTEPAKPGKQVGLIINNEYPPLILISSRTSHIAFHVKLKLKNNENFVFKIFIL